MEPGTFNTIDSIGFYSHQIEKITGQRITGYLNNENSSGTNIKKSLAKYEQVGKAIVEARTEACYNRRQLAEFLGISYNALRLYE